MKALTHRIWLAAVASLWAGLAVAGTGSSFLDVSITLNNPNVVVLPSAAGGLPTATERSAICTNETLNEQTNAMVRVVCGSSQFVSIAPLPGKPFLGTHGGAFRYALGASNFAGMPNRAGTGTVTALRIYNANGSNGPLEMLVSF